MSTRAQERQRCTKKWRAGPTRFACYTTPRNPNPTPTTRGLTRKGVETGTSPRYATHSTTNSQGYSNRNLTKLQTKPDTFKDCDSQGCSNRNLSWKRSWQSQAQATQRWHCRQDGSLQSHLDAGNTPWLRWDLDLRSRCSRVFSLCRVLWLRNRGGCEGESVLLGTCRARPAWYLGLQGASHWPTA